MNDALKRTLLWVAVALGLAAVVTVLVGVPVGGPPGVRPGGGMGPGAGRMGGPYAEMTILVQVKAFLATFNVVLLFALAWNYAHVYRDLPNPFTGSLLLFTAALLAYAVAANPLIYFLLGYRGGAGLGPFTFLSDLFAAVAIVVLLYQSYR
jgi:uncharacterized membrane protein